MTDMPAVVVATVSIASVDVRAIAAAVSFLQSQRQQLPILCHDRDLLLMQMNWTLKVALSSVASSLARNNVRSWSVIAVATKQKSKSENPALRTGGEGGFCGNMPNKSTHKGTSHDCSERVA
jgi:hypothetical protein